MMMKLLSLAVLMASVFVAVEAGDNPSSAYPLARKASLQHFKRSGRDNIKGARRDRRLKGKGGEDAEPNSAAGAHQSTQTGYTAPTGLLAGGFFAPPSGQTAQNPQTTAGEAGTKTGKGQTPKALKLAPPAGARAANPYTTSSSAMKTYDNKCDAAAAGAEYKTDFFVPVYYQYEVLTTLTRNILDLADIIDGAVQDFLAAWLVDCPGGGGNRRMRRRALLQEQATPKFHRLLQMSLAPIVGTGVGDPDTVLLRGSHPCQSLVPDVTQGQMCYKVIGSSNIYLNDTMQVNAADLRSLVQQTLTVGMNYASTDFSLLDSGIYDLFFFQGYDAPPTQLIQENQDANKRSWDTSQSSNPTSQSSNPLVVNKGRSGGAKFGIAFATLLCIALAVLIVVFLCMNRRKLMRYEDEEWTWCCCCEINFSSRNSNEARKSGKNVDEDLTAYKRKQRRALRDYHDADEEAISLDGTFHTSSTSPASTINTRTISPELETPRQYSAGPTYLRTESNIETPVSDWGAHPIDLSEFASHNNAFRTAVTPNEPIRVSLSKDAIRGSSRKTTPSSSYTPASRIRGCDDTVDL